MKIWAELMIPDLEWAKLAPALRIKAIARRSRERCESCFRKKIRIPIRVNGKLCVISTFGQNCLSVFRTHIFQSVCQKSGHRGDPRCHSSVTSGEIIQLSFTRGAEQPEAFKCCKGSSRKISPRIHLFTKVCYSMNASGARFLTSQDRFSFL